MPNIGDLMQQIGGIALLWLPLLMFGLIIYLLFRTLQVMPRVKTTKVPPSSELVRSAGTTSRVSRRPARRWRRSSTSCATRSASLRSARACRRASCSTGLRGPARRCSRRPSPTSPARSFYSQSASAFVEMFAGLGAARIRKLFEEARKNEPAIVFIDELDAVGTARTGHGFNREQDQTLNQLLVELDGFTNRDQVVVMGASNRLQDLDPALLRPGRFDRQILVSPPDLAGREEILQRPHARQAARRRRRPHVDRPPDRRPDRRRPREHRERGGDLRRPRQAAIHPPGPLRRRSGAQSSPASSSER